MEFKEKIIQYWLTFVLTFLGFSKTLIIVPVFLQFEFSNYYLVGFINLVFWPAEHIYRIFEGFAEASGLLMFAVVLLAIVRLALFATEAYVLVFLFLKLSFSKSFQIRLRSLIEKKLFELKEKSSSLNSYNSERNIKSVRNYLPFVVGFMLIFSLSVGGYFIVKNYQSQKQVKNSMATEEEKRDDQRLAHIVKIKEALENYAKEHKGFYFITDGIEKISDENSSSFLVLRNGNYISKLYADPLPDKYFYGYASDGKSYELTAVLEKKKDKCVQEGDICVYKIRQSDSNKNIEENNTEKLVVQNSSVVSNPCNPSTVTDIDGNIYNTVKIGTQCWMKENLKVTKNPQGKQIDRDCYDNNLEICNTDGGLYTWLAAMNIIISDITTFKSSIQAREPAQGICPNGWHIPRDSEWSTLENYLEENKAKTASGSFMLCSGADGYWIGCGSAGVKLRQGGSSGFEAVYTGSVENSHSPIALPNEFWYQEYLYKTNWEDIDSASKFHSRGESAYFWSSTSLPPYIPQGYPNTRLYEAWFRKLSSVHGGTLKDNAIKNRGGMSVRCIRN